MIVLIDGYNLLKQIFPGAKHNLDKQKRQFIQQLAFYKAKKSDAIKEIIVVFDAGPFSHAYREIKSGITVIYSGQKSCADKWIENYVAKHKQKHCLIVTLDRQLTQACEKYGTYSISVYDFYHLMQDALLDQAAPTPTSTNTTQDLTKYDSSDHDNYDLLELSTEQSKALDLLMEQASMNIPKDTEKPSKPKILTKDKHKRTKKKDKKKIITLKKLH
ncbi:MAG: NYN domain-containing protein [Epsilonproteobacteria bacterium]|nr:NYN domain-containing protein [Campylobacterota bacterium]